jgi:hypothetical protein
VNAVRCLGLCVVAAETTLVPKEPLDPPSQPSAGVEFASPIPWIVRAELPTGSAPLLRYNVTFDRKWVAIFSGAILPHMRIDGAVNGWIVPMRARPTTVYLIETGAAMTTLSEVVAVGVFGLVSLYALRRRATARTFPIDATASRETTM